ncbi:hypothetical protein LTS18_013448 [Coniosporium uncinatum]|uniref:Uncharacterized protein n=1 Tax=Coniosporium uncinatum TaxID=93489 RepID=A0ACC3DHU3_9PEZI|nr:hypothetical protein LTS18_013448 [Coniosporium uncinatum]
MANLQMSAEYEDRIQHNVSDVEVIARINTSSRLSRKLHNISDKPPAFLNNITSLRIRYCSDEWCDLDRTVGEIVTMFPHLRNIKIDEWATSMVLADTQSVKVEIRDHCGISVTALLECFFCDEYMGVNRPKTLKVARKRLIGREEGDGEDMEVLLSRTETWDGNQCTGVEDYKHPRLTGVEASVKLLSYETHC